MAEIENQEPTFPIKCKSGIHSQNNEDFPKKSQKIQALDSNYSFADSEDCNRQECEDMPKMGNVSPVLNDNSCALSEVKSIKQDASFTDLEVDDIRVHQNGNYGDVEDKGLNGESEVDRKGKRITLGDKGKGKMIVENDEGEDEDDTEDDDDSRDDGEFSSDDSDLSDDPLAEVDLENVLPSRTRKRKFHPGIYISNDLVNDANEEDNADSVDSEG